MSETKVIRLSKVARELNVGIGTIVDFLHKKGINIEANPNTKISEEHYALLLKEYSKDLSLKKEIEKIDLSHLKDKHETVTLKIDEEENENDLDNDTLLKDLRPSQEIFETETEKLIEKGETIKLNIIGKIDLEKPKKKEEKQIKKNITEEITENNSQVKEEIENNTPVIEKVTENLDIKYEQEEITVIPESGQTIEEDSEEKDQAQKKFDLKVVGKIDLSALNQKTRPTKKEKPIFEKKIKEKEEEQKILQTKVSEPVQKVSEKTEQPKIKAEKVDISKITEEGEDFFDKKKKKKRKRIKLEREKIKPEERREGKPDDSKFKKFKKFKKSYHHYEIDEEEVEKQIKDTFSKLAQQGKSKAEKYKREKKELIKQKLQAEQEKLEQEKKILKIAEFATVSELANMMDVPVTDVITTCLHMGLVVSINQRLDADTISLIADEFGYQVEIVDIEEDLEIKEEEDKPEDLKPRPPIVTVMGHVDHGKTKLLDYIRNTNVVAGEAGGITQHIGAYSVELEDGRQITFLDTPGHEAFTAMRARGAKVTDVAIIVVAADDGVKPQTVEAISHAQAAGVPMVFAINKIDKPEANPEKVKEELAKMNILVEDWGGRYQCQEISAKTGQGVKDLLEKVLLEAEMLELKANPNKKASGTVIESSLDKGRGYVATLLVQNGTLRVGDIILAGTHYGKVKAMFNERGKKIDVAPPSTPVLVLGLNGAPQAGDKFNVMDSEKEAKEIATKRAQLIREQGIRAQKHITLDEIGRRIAIGNFKELNIIVKGDVDGSVEALSDSLIKLSTEEIQVNIIHKGVGQISESDVLLASASNAIIIGFQVRPSMQARKLAEQENIEIRLYSIIYDAINDVKSAMEGMLSPEIKEEIVGTAEVLATFKISKVGTVAGCLVKEGKITKNTKVRVIRDGIVIYTGELSSLKRFKDDVKEVTAGQECGMSIANFNDIKVGDIIEGYEIKEIKKKL